MDNIATNIKHIQERVRSVQAHYQLPARDVTIVAVSKYQGVDAIMRAIDAGHRVFGENRVQEASEKWPKLKEQYPDICLHLIGPLQTNKIKDALQLFDVIEVVDRKKLVNGLVQQSRKLNKVITYYLQVNTGEEPQKAGVLPNQVDALLGACQEQKLNITGLMCIPPLDQLASSHFALLADMGRRHHLSDLSMGMSHDFEAAIALGATHIRIGTAIFGQRSQ